MGVLARAIVELLPKGSGSGDREVEALPSEIDREAQTPCRGGIIIMVLSFRR